MSIKLQIALAPRDMPTKEVVKAIYHDPHQSRLSLGPHLYLTHPSKRTTLILSEYVEQYLETPRFAIETSDSLVFISKLNYEPYGGIFVVSKVILKSEIDNLLKKEE
jgi:hypothetical protein